MSISIDMYEDCPHCKQHIPYHCDTPEKIRACRWMKENAITGQMFGIVEIMREWWEWEFWKFSHPSTRSAVHDLHMGINQHDRSYVRWVADGTHEGRSEWVNPDRWR